MANGSPPVLHLELGPDFLLEVLDRYGVHGWNRWLAEMTPFLGGVWAEGEDEPPICIFFEVGGDFSGQNLNGISLWGVVSCDGLRLDNGSAVGARIGSCIGASFRDADLRNAVFTADISGADYRGANLEGASFDDVIFDPSNPPVGLPDDLLRECVPNSLEQYDFESAHEFGLDQHPVSLKASIADSYTS